MPIPVDCPACNTRLRAPDGAAGMTLSCPRCQAPVPVPPGPDGIRATGQAAPNPAPPPRSPAPPRTPSRSPSPERQHRGLAPRRTDPSGNGCLTALAWVFALVALAGIAWLLLVRPQA